MSHRASKGVKQRLSPTPNDAGEAPQGGNDRRVTLREARAARLRRQRLLVLPAAAGALAVRSCCSSRSAPSPPTSTARATAPRLSAQASRRPPYRVTAWTLGDAASLETATAANAVDEVDFDWYHAQADGSVTAQDEDPDLVAAARGHDLNLFATVTNSTSSGSVFSRDLAAAILASPDRRRRFIDDLVTLVEDMGYDGVDLDWEDLKPADRNGFSALVEDLADALHAKDRFLSHRRHAQDVRARRVGQPEVRRLEPHRQGRGRVQDHDLQLQRPLGRPRSAGAAGVGRPRAHVRRAQGAAGQGLPGPAVLRVRLARRLGRHRLRAPRRVAGRRPTTPP